MHIQRVLIHIIFIVIPNLLYDHIPCENAPLIFYQQFQYPVFRNGQLYRFIRYVHLHPLKVNTHIPIMKTFALYPIRCIFTSSKDCLYPLIQKFHGKRLRYIVIAAGPEPLYHISLRISCREEDDRDLCTFSQFSAIVKAPSIGKVSVKQYQIEAMFQAAIRLLA